MPALNAPLDMVDDAGNREYPGFLEVPLEAHPFWGCKLLLEEVIEALHTQE